MPFSLLTTSQRCRRPPISSAPDIICKRLDYWTFILGPKFSAKERRKIKLSRTYAVSQVEYCVNCIFKRNFPIHKLFERSCELGLWRLTAHKIAEVFGTRLRRNHRASSSPSSIKSSTATMCSASISKTQFSGSMRSSQCFCAMNSAPTTFTTSVSKRAWTIRTRFVRSSRLSSAASQLSRPNGSMSTSIFLCYSASLCQRSRLGPLFG
jgi:hypothetical protein